MCSAHIDLKAMVSDLAAKQSDLAAQISDFAAKQSDLAAKQSDLAVSMDDLTSSGFCPPSLFYNTKKIKLLKLLGKGSFARVYRCEVEDFKVPHVAKLFHRGEDITTEERNLLLVNDKFKTVFVNSAKPNYIFTRLVGTCTDTEGKPNALLLSPEGTQFVGDVPQIRAAHLKLLRKEDLFEQNHLLASCQIFCALIDALQFLHVQCRLVHRDVKLSNFLLVKVSSHLSVGNTSVHPPVDAVVITNPLSVFTTYLFQIQNEYKVLLNDLGSAATAG